MAEFTEVMNHAKIMCENIDDCRDCPLSSFSDECFFEDFRSSSEIQRAENVIENWWKDYVVNSNPTWRSWWLSMFPECTSIPCPKKYFGAECKHITLNGCEHCLDEPIPQEIVAKLMRSREVVCWKKQ